MMDKFTQITSVAAPLPQADVDTDMILPAPFLLRIERAGLGKCVFAGARRPQPGKPPFVLDQDAYKNAKIIVGGPRFGIGSSREQAVWSLLDAGISCIIAPSFGEIFYANCMRNGLLAIVQTGDNHAAIMAAAQAAQPLHIDLPAQQITLNGRALPFEISAHHKAALLDGLDETGGILKDHGAAIAAFEAQQARTSPWLKIPDAAFDDFAFYKGKSGAPDA